MTLKHYFDTKWLLCPIHFRGRKSFRRQTKSAVATRFFAVFLVDNEMVRLDTIEQHQLDNKDILLIVDRIVVKDEEFYNRLADAVQTTFYEGKGICYLQEVDSKKTIGIQF